MTPPNETTPNTPSCCGPDCCSGSATTSTTTPSGDQVREKVREGYAGIARSGQWSGVRPASAPVNDDAGCCGGASSGGGGCCGAREVLGHRGPPATFGRVPDGGLRTCCEGSAEENGAAREPDCRFRRLALKDRAASLSGAVAIPYEEGRSVASCSYPKQRQQHGPERAAPVVEEQRGGPRGAAY